MDLSSGAAAPAAAGSSSACRPQQLLVLHLLVRALMLVVCDAGRALGSQRASLHTEELPRRALLPTHCAAFTALQQGPGGSTKHKQPHLAADCITAHSALLWLHRRAAACSLWLWLQRCMELPVNLLGSYRVAFLCTHSLGEGPVLCRTRQAPCRGMHLAIQQGACLPERMPPQRCSGLRCVYPCCRPAHACSHGARAEIVHGSDTIARQARQRALLQHCCSEAPACSMCSKLRCPVWKGRHALHDERCTLPLCALLRWGVAAMLPLTQQAACTQPAMLLTYKQRAALRLGFRLCLLHFRV